MFPSDKVGAGTAVAGMVQTGRGFPFFYVETNSAGRNAGQLYGIYTPAYYDSITAALRSSPHFKTVFDQGGTQVFELRPPTGS
jgi:hypothetical protein